MFVQKRDGRHESVSFDKITARVTKLSYGLHPDFCDPVIPLSLRLLYHGVCMSKPVAIKTDCPPQVLVAQKVTTGVYKGVTTSELDDLAAETAASMTATHPDYATVRASFLSTYHCEQRLPGC